MEAKGEKLLQDLVNQEKVVIEKVDKARAEANSILEEARARANSILSTANDKIKQLQADKAQQSEADAETERTSVLDSVRSTVDDLEAKAKANSDKAVSLIMERVLP